MALRRERRIIREIVSEIVSKIAVNIAHIISKIVCVFDRIDSIHMKVVSISSISSKIESQWRERGRV
jgi:hypothetical protein